MKSSGADLKAYLFNEVQSERKKNTFLPFILVLSLKDVRDKIEHYKP